MINNERVEYVKKVLNDGVNRAAEADLIVATMIWENYGLQKRRAYFENGLEAYTWLKGIEKTLIVINAPYIGYIGYEENMSYRFYEEG